MPLLWADAQKKKQHNENQEISILSSQSFD